MPVFQPDPKKNTTFLPRRTQPLLFELGLEGFNLLGCLARKDLDDCLIQAQADAAALRYDLPYGL